jgi:hypothetical protein
MTNHRKATASLPEKQTEIEALTQALAAPFDTRVVKFKPAVVSGNRALALAYIDARVIQDRLDEVVGVLGWQDEYECLPDGSVVCKLRLRLGDEWITKMDIGGPSEQPDEGDRRKAAFSDALRRAAVKFGIGHYLYRLPNHWVDYDLRKRQFLKTPALPAYALPQNTRQEQAVQQKGLAAARSQGTEPATVPMTTVAEPEKSARSASGMPANGIELQKRLHAYDAQLARQGLCAEGALVKHIVEAGMKAGYEPDLATWSGAAITMAVDQTKQFEASLRRRASKDVA